MRLPLKTVASSALKMGARSALKFNSFIFVLAATISTAPVTAFSAAAELVSTTSAIPLQAEFDMAVSPHLALPSTEAVAYARLLQDALVKAQVFLAADQFVLLVDRSRNVQAALLFFGSATRGWGLVGAAPVSTGLPGRFEHFLTPLGVFDHSVANPDFRAEGTKNKLGFRGYGRKGMRVYDFGWIDSPRGWGNGAMGVLRLQMHATDPNLAAQHLGTAQSEGCVRIPATLNDFIDMYGLLDDDYARAVAGGQNLWVLNKKRTPTINPGRYMVVIDTDRPERPEWSPLPVKPSPVRQ